MKSEASIYIESFTMGWFNIFIAGLWDSVLEKYVSDIAVNALQRSFNEVRAGI